MKKFLLLRLFLLFAMMFAGDFLLRKQGGDFCFDDVDGDVVFAATGDDDVGVDHGGEDEFEVHGADGLVILVEDAGDVAASFDDVTLYTPAEADVERCVDEEFDVEEFANFRIGK